MRVRILGRKVEAKGRWYYRKATLQLSCGHSTVTLWRLSAREKQYPCGICEALRRNRR